MNRLSRLILLAGLPFVVVASISCSSTSQGGGGAASITKVNPYHLKPGERIRTEDRMIAFEQVHHYHGAITAEEFMEKFGQYFTIFWKNEAKGASYTVSLDYTQANTGATIHTKQVPVANAGRRNTTKIEITGNDYHTNGPVTSWKASLLSGDQVVAEWRSFLWK